jgi:diguanylate cyclase (GGDEF)-like protein/PAS domain S-box-containing protein
MKNISLSHNYEDEHHKLLEFTKLIESSGVIVFRCSVDNECRVLDISENIAQFGYSSDDFLSDKIHYKSLIHDDDIEYFIEQLEKNLHSDVDKFSLLHRIITADAKIRWLDVKFLIERDASDAAQMVYGTVNDITEIVEKENQVKLLAKALEQSDNLVFITDVNGIITYVNDSVVKHSGYSREELLGSKTNIFKSSLHDKDFYKQLWKTILSGENYNNVITNKKKNGELYYVDTSITPIDDKYTRTKNFVATAKDVTIQMKLEKKLENLATTDSLTQIYNRYKINAEIELHIARAKRNNTPFSVLMFDIDHFKAVNDKYGHYVGDVVLKDLTHVIEKNIREVDSFGRWGGEEFMLVLDNASKNEAVSVAQKIRRTVEATPMSGHYKITVSIGVSQYRISEQKSTLLERVDQALYEAKEGGRNQVVFK